MKTGFEVLREVMVAGYKPSVARLYDPDDGGIHFSHFAADGRLRAAVHGRGRGRASPRRPPRASTRSSPRHPECAQVDERPTSRPGSTTSSGAPEQDHRRGRAHPHDAQRQPHDRDLGRLELDQRHLRGGARSASERDPRHHDGRRPLLAQLHQRHQHVLQLLLRPRRLRARGGGRRSTTCRSSRIICEETLRRGGSIVHHHGIGKARAPWVRDEYGSSYYILETLKRAFDPNGIMNKGTIIPL